MRYWLTAIVAAALTIAGGWFVLLNQDDVFVHVAPERAVAAPLGATLLTALPGAAGLVALLTMGGAITGAWRSTRARRRARREARGRETTARARHLVWAGETSAARAELLRAPEHPDSDASRLALLAETHLLEGDAAAARDVLERASPTTAGEPRLLALLAH